MRGIVSQELKKLIKEEVFPGAALRVRQRGEIVFEECEGYADREAKIAVKENTIYRLCSMSKLITAVGVMQLYEKNLLSLDDKIAKYFPEYPEDKANVTIRHLLNHCCGYGQGEKGTAYLLETLDMKEILEDRVKKWAYMPLDYPVGTSPAYSGIVSFDTLGRIIEIVSGQDLFIYFRKNIFEPLEMNDTVFCLDEEKQSRSAKLYSGEDGELKPVPNQMPYVSARNGYYSGAAGLCGTLNDFDTFTTMLYYGGTWKGKQFIKEDTLKLMRTPRQILNSEAVPGCPWGLGFMIFEQPEKAGRSLGRNTFGWSGAYGTHMYIDPENDLCMTLMAGRADIGGAGSIASKRLEDAIFQEFC